MGLLAKYVTEAAVHDVASQDGEAESSYFRFHVKGLSALHCITNSCDNLLSLSGDTAEERVSRVLHRKPTRRILRFEEYNLNV